MKRRYNLVALDDLDVGQPLMDRDGNDTIFEGADGMCAFIEAGREDGALIQVDVGPGQMFLVPDPKATFFSLF